MAKKHFINYVIFVTAH